MRSWLTNGSIMSKTTPATLALTRAGIAFAAAAYDYHPGADHIGVQAAEALGVAPHLVLKTLMAEVDGKPVCVVVPSDHEVSMKKLAAAFAGKSAQMLKPDAAERLTGYKVGGISPFGQKRKVPTAIEATALGLAEVFINGGQRGLLLKLSPADALRAAEAKAVALVAEK
jgi:Cys-tRNA(Pro)/Cys-tRNA(Cys) deacylase